MKFRSNSTVHYTTHAVERAAERFQWGKTKLRKMMRRAYRLGQPPHPRDFARRRGYDARTGELKNGSLLVLDEIVFVFVQRRLVTLYPVAG